MKNTIKNIYYWWLFWSIAIFLITALIFIFKLETFNFILYLLIYISFFLWWFYVWKKYVKKKFSWILTNIMLYFNLIVLFFWVCWYSYFIFFLSGFDWHLYVFYVLYTLWFILLPYYHIFIISMMILYFIKSIFFKKYKEEWFDWLFFYAFYHSLAWFVLSWLYQMIFDLVYKIFH